jgi:hypothetical protein
VCAWASSGLEHPGAQRQTSRNSGRSMDGRASAAAAYVWRGIPIYFFCVHISFSATIQKKKTNKRKGWEYLREEAAGKEKKMKEKKGVVLPKASARTSSRYGLSSRDPHSRWLLLVSTVKPKTKPDGWMDG